MNIIINGESRDFANGLTVMNVLHELSLEGKVMAAANYLILLVVVSFFQV